MTTTWKQVVTNIVMSCPAPADADPVTTQSGQPRRIWPEKVRVELFERDSDNPTRSIHVEVTGVAALADGGRGTRRGVAHFRTDLVNAPDWVRELAAPMIAELEQEGRLVRT